jgi:hypothetical protein
LSGSALTTRSHANRTDEAALDGALLDGALLDGALLDGALLAAVDPADPPAADGETDASVFTVDDDGEAADGPVFDVGDGCEFVLGEELVGAAVLGDVDDEGV